MAKKYAIPTSIDLAVLILRAGSSFFMMHFGWEKLQNILNGNWDFPDPLGIGSTASVLLTIFAELFCSLALLLGFLSRPAALILAFTMGVAAFKIHASDPLSTKEHALTYLIIYIAIIIMGPGRFSLDQKLVNKYF